jgi:hypothetical protein
MVNRGSLDRMIFRIDSAKVGINYNGSIIPDRFILRQNYPNPFNPVTKISFDVPQSTGELRSEVKLAVYDISGKEVSLLVNGNLAPGKYEYLFTGSNLSSGTYFYKLDGNGFSQIRKMVLLK